MATIQVTVPPTITPWTLQDAKDHLHVTHSNDDNYVQLLTFAVVNMTEKITRRALFTQTVKEYWDYFFGEMNLSRTVVQSITAITYYDSTGTLVTLDSDAYQSDLITEPARLLPAPWRVWPPTQWSKMNAVCTEYICGWTSRGQLPDALRQAMLMLLSHLYDHREPLVEGLMVSEIPWGIQTLFEPFRVVTFSK